MKLTTGTILPNFDAKATPIVPTNTRFAENPIPASFNGEPNKGAGTIDTNDAADGAANPKLYRVSTGHGGVFCEGCHGATHAEFDTDAADSHLHSAPPGNLRGLCRS